MRVLSVLLFLAFFFVFTGSARAQLAKPQVADNESGVDQVLLQKNDAVLYVTRWSYTRVNEGGKSFLIWKAKGDNDKQGAERIDWTEDGKVEETADGLRTASWKKRSTGAEQMDWELRYDWAAGRCVYSFADRATGKKELKPGFSI
jgi:hypothetical protein